MGNAIFRGLPAPKPLGRFSKTIAGLITSGTPPHMQVVGQSVQRGVSAHAWICHRQVSIFFFLRFNAHCYRSARWTVNGSNDASSWPSRPFYGFDNKKKIFSQFLPKMWKVALHPTGTLNSYNFGIVEDTYRVVQKSGTPVLILR